jgi:Cytochrome c
MKRSTFVMFGLVVLLFAVLIPAWAISREGSEEASPESVPSNLEEGKQLFVTNCGACHTLAKAGTDGVVGPNLDELLAPPIRRRSSRGCSPRSRTVSAAGCRRGSSPVNRRRRSRISSPRSPAGRAR